MYRVWHSAPTERPLPQVGGTISSGFGISEQAKSSEPYKGIRALSGTWHSARTANGSHPEVMIKRQNCGISKGESSLPPSLVEEPRSKRSHSSARKVMAS